MQIWRPRNYPEQLNVRVDMSLVAWLTEKATVEKLSMSGYARKVLEEAARRDLQADHRDDPWRCAGEPTDAA